MTADREKHSCENCRFWTGFEELADEISQDGKLTLGVCNRFPPQPDVALLLAVIIRNNERAPRCASQEWSFPHTRYDDWCGEWKKA